MHNYGELFLSSPLYFTGERGESSVLFVKNLSYNVDEEALKEAFPDAVGARVARFPDTGKHRG